MRRKQHNFFPEPLRVTPARAGCLFFLGYVFLGWWASMEWKGKPHVIAMVAGVAMVAFLCWWHRRLGLRVSEEGLYEVFRRREVLHPWDTIRQVREQLLASGGSQVIVTTDTGEITFTSAVPDWPRLAAHIRARCGEAEPTAEAKRRDPTAEELLRFLGAGSRLPAVLGVSPGLTCWVWGLPLLMVAGLFLAAITGFGLLIAALGVFPVWILLLRDWLQRWRRRIIVDTYGLEVRDEKGQAQRYAWSEVLDLSHRQVTGSTIPEEYQVRMCWGVWRFDSALYGHERLAAVLQGVLSLGPAHYPAERLLDIPDTALSRARPPAEPVPGAASLSRASTVDDSRDTSTNQERLLAEPVEASEGEVATVRVDA
jgi:hypothetical protein